MLVPCPDCKMKIRNIISSLLSVLLLFSIFSTELMAYEVAGILPGELSVTQTGAAQYSVPLAVPKGTAGMEPSLSLDYNSQSGSGLLGIGWSLSGLSAIARCGRTIVQDGASGGIEFTDNDRYCLDGQRLVAVKGAYGHSGTEYRTEIDSFARIVSHGRQGKGPAWFSVQTKSGQTIQYGNTGDARIEAQGKSEVFVWAQNRITGAAGNTLTVSYHENNANTEYYPNRIDYSGVSVRFHYHNKTHSVAGYRAGSRIKSTKRLTSISTWHRETKIGDYRLTYQQRDKRPALLNAIEQCDSGGICFPATSMVWENEIDQGFGGEIGTGVIDKGYDNNRWWVDVTGDGRSDFCRLVGSQGRYRVSCKISTGSGFGAEVSTGVIDPGYAHNRGWADVNGDGRGDFCRLVGSSGKYRVTCKASVGNGFGAEISTGVIGPSEDKNPWWWVDFNGDGRSDFCRFVYGVDNLTYQMSCKISTGAEFGRDIRSGYLNSGWDDNNRWWADINGDGKSDFCRMVWVSPGKYQMDCKVSLGNSFGSEIGTGVIDVGYESNRWWVDINGDGLSDFCRLVGSRNQANCKVSIGTGFGQEIRTGVIDVGYEGHRWWADANGDGLSDYCRLVGGAGNYRVHCKSSTANGFGAEISTGVIDPGYDHSRWWADINGDGAADYVRLVGGTGKYRVTAKSTTQKPTLVSSIITGLGEQTRITYKPLNDGSVHSIGKGAAYPERDIQGPLHVVSQTKRDNGLGGDITTQYNYGGAKVDIHGRGFLGFEWMKAADTQTGITTTTTYRQDFPYTGKVAATEQRQANGKLLGRTTATWAKQTQHGGKTHFPYISRSVDAQYQLDSHHISTSTTDSQYDGYGNPTRIIATTEGGGEQVVKESINQYINHTDRWHLGRLTRANVTHTTGQGRLTKTSAFAYNANGLLIQEIIEPDKPALRLVTDTTYDRFGNKIKTTTHGNGVEPRTTTTAYTTDGRFPQSTTNALGHTETYTYDPLHGVMTSLRGPNGLTTRWQYDRFGRKTREDRADGTWSTITRGFCQHGDCPADAPWNSALVTTTQSAGSTPVTTYADKLGRVIREQRVGFDGTPVYQDTQYNALGQIERVSLPYFAGETAYWSTNTYDLLGRVIRTDSQQSNGATRTTQISHRGRTTVTTDPLGHQKTTIKNLLGKVARVEQEEHAWVNYTYDPTGNLTRTDSNGSITQLSYDLRGRKTAMNDPNMGRWTYAYNAFGELTSQTDAKGQTVTMQYDPLGRMIKRTEPEGTTTWQYDSADHGIGKLHQVTGPDGYTKTHSYDTLGRPQGTEQQVGGTTLAHQLEYDQYGRNNKETRPNGFILTKHYNAQGYLEAVQTPSNQIDDYDWTHLEQLLEDSLVNVEDALRRAGEYQKKADYYTKWAGIYQRIADYYAKSSTKYQALAQQVRGSVEELLKVADELQRQAERYERLAHSYMIAMRRFVHLSSLDVAADQSRSYTDTSADISTWNNYFLGGGGTAKSLANGYAWCSNLATCQFWGRVSQRIAEMYQRLAAGKAAKANLYRTASEDEQLRLANELADQRLEKSAYYQRKSDDYRERVEQNLKKAQDAQQQAGYWQGVAERALDESLSPHYQAMLADRDNITLWRAVSRDAAGRLTQHINGNGLSTRNHYDQATGQLHSIMTGFSLSGDVRHISYRYDQANNLLERTDERTGFHEQFGYDRLERLTHTNVYGRIGNIDYHYDVSQTYDAQGNITHKSDMGDYQYDPNRSQQVISAGTKHIGYQYDANGNITQGGGRQFEWASYNKPTRLQKGDSIVSFNYGAEHNRYRKVARINGETITTDYFGKLYEKETSQSAIDHKHHIYADGQLVAIHIEHQQGGADETRYLHYDALGSIDTITDGKGKVVERMSYDPWGKRRGGDWRIDDPLNATQFHLALFTNRGFTGHEHIDELELIHMNGRVYDPELGRFLSADPHVQSPANPQSLNRYSYVNNNPLSYTDPSGYFFKSLFKAVKKLFKNKIVRAVAAIAAAYFSAGLYAMAVTPGASMSFALGTLTTTQAAIAGAIGGFVGGIVGSGGDLRAGIIGGLTGGLAGYVGSSMSFGYRGTITAQRVVAHGVVGGISSEMSGGKFIKGFLSNAFTKSVSGRIHAATRGNAIGGSIAAAVFGGTASRLTGGKFGNGAMTAAFSYLFNEWMSNQRDPESVSMVGIKRSPYSVGVSGDLQLPGVAVGNLATGEQVPTGMSLSLMVDHNASGQVVNVTPDGSIVHDVGLNTGYGTVTIDFITQHNGYTDSIDFFLGIGGRVYLSSDGITGVGFGFGYKPNGIGKIINYFRKTPVINISEGTETSIRDM